MSTFSTSQRSAMAPVHPTEAFHTLALKMIDLQAKVRAKARAVTPLYRNLEAWYKTQRHIVSNLPASGAAFLVRRPIPPVMAGVEAACGVFVGETDYVCFGNDTKTAYKMACRAGRILSHGTRDIPYDFRPKVELLFIDKNLFAVRRIK